VCGGFKAGEGYVFEITKNPFVYLIRAFSFEKNDFMVLFPSQYISAGTHFGGI